MLVGRAVLCPEAAREGRDANGSGGDTRQLSFMLEGRAVLCPVAAREGRDADGSGGDTRQLSFMLEGRAVVTVYLQICGQT